MCGIVGYVGDRECKELLLAGLELYATLGREFELLETMRTFAREMHEAVQGTPTARELEELFNREPPARAPEA